MSDQGRQKPRSNFSAFLITDQQGEDCLERAKELKCFLIYKTEDFFFTVFFISLITA